MFIKLVTKSETTVMLNAQNISNIIYRDKSIDVYMNNDNENYFSFPRSNEMETSLESILMKLP